jgi:hypothetical protein
MNVNVTDVTKMLHAKSIWALLAGVLLILGGVYTIDQQQQGGTQQPQKDVYVDTIQKNSEYISGQVAILAKGQPAGREYLPYFHSCEVLLDNIRGQNQEAEQNFDKISTGHKDINVKYRAFLHEAANAVLISEQGGTPDLSAMEKRKAALY